MANRTLLGGDHSSSDICNQAELTGTGQVTTIVCKILLQETKTPSYAIGMNDHDQCD
ncbi:hypothetical protein DPMN_114573 [Dreissena polymorpha]|uniref:Uncharacterized protein n=1 Tax=Dreissena polymorpha TaxID=45954 RepID=A0A9D4KK54_DREPO|nr:hypothetical protein DPMN_114573 [Dreissena polymorpha]